MHQAIEPKGCSHGAGFLFQFQSLLTACRSLISFHLPGNFASSYSKFLQQATCNYHVKGAHSLYYLT